MWALVHGQDWMQIGDPPQWNLTHLNKEILSHHVSAPYAINYNKKPSGLKTLDICKVHNHWRGGGIIKMLDTITPNELNTLITIYEEKNCNFQIIFINSLWLILLAVIRYFQGLFYQLIQKARLLYFFIWMWTTDSWPLIHLKVEASWAPSVISDFIVICCLTSMFLQQVFSLKSGSMLCFLSFWGSPPAAHT